MACNARQVLADGIGFSGLTTRQAKAAQLQLVADALGSMSPGTDVSVGAIMARAKANGICCLTRSQLRAATLQLTCDIENTVEHPPNNPIVENDLAQLVDATEQTDYITDAYQPAANTLVLAVVWNSLTGGATAPVSFSGNGLTWDLVQTRSYSIKGSKRVSVFRSMGAAPTNTTGTVSFGATAQGACIIKVLEFTNVNTSGANGIGAVAQSTTALGLFNPSLTLASLDSSGRNAVIGFSSNALNPYGGVPEAGWVENLDIGITTGLSMGAYITYQLMSTDNTIAITASPAAWVLIGMEINAI